MEFPKPKLKPKSNTPLGNPPAVNPWAKPVVEEVEPELFQQPKFTHDPSLAQEPSDRQLARVLGELALRKREALALWKPNEQQDGFHASHARIRLLLGGNRCLGGDTEIYDPVLQCKRRIDEIDGPFHVWSRNPETGDFEIRESSQPFIKAFDELYRVTLSNGEQFTATMEHRMVGASRGWVSLREAAAGAPLLGRQLLPQTVRDKNTPFQGDSQSPLPSLARSWSEASQQCVQAMATRLSRLACRGSWGFHRLARASAQQTHCTQTFGQSLQPTSWRTVAQVPLSPATSLSVSQRQPACWPSLASTILGTFLSRCVAGVQSSWRTVQGYLGCCFACCRPCDEPLLAVPGSGQSAVPSQADAPERSQSYLHGDGLVGEPGYSRTCQQYALPASQDDLRQGEAREVLIQFPSCKGVSAQSETQCHTSLRSAGWSSSPGSTDAQVHHDQSETIFAASHPPFFQGYIEDQLLYVISVVSIGQGIVWDISVPPYSNYWVGGVSHGNSGKTTCGAAEVARIVLNRDPHEKYPNKGTLVIVSKDFDTLSNTIWPALCMPGAFHVIQDTTTGLWRTVDPVADLPLKDRWRPSEPLIPRRYFAREPVWLYAGKNVPAQLHLKTGWRILFYSGKSPPKVGFKADVAWIDEEVENEMWFRELQMRLVDRRGKLFWTATPENSTAQLMDLHKQWMSGSEDIAEFVMSTLDNPFLPQDYIQDVMKTTSAEDIAVKIHGRFRIGEALVFTEFDMRVHGVEPFDIPNHWTRYAAIDPGVNPGAVLFAAVPPDDDEQYGGHVYIYDELYLHKCSADVMADAMAEKMKGQKIEAFIIDYQMARQRELGAGETVEYQYTKAFERHKVRSVSLGANFIAGSQDPRGRREALKSWMRGNDPVFRVLKGRCPMLEWELPRYRFLRDKHQELTDKVDKRNDHLVDCACYLASHKPRYVERKQAGERGGVFEQFQRKLAARSKNRGSIVFGPGGMRRD